MIVSKQREEKPQPKNCRSWAFKIYALYPFFCRISAGASFYPCLLLFPKERHLGFPSHRGGRNFWSRTDYSPVKKITLLAGYTMEMFTFQSH